MSYDKDIGIGIKIEVDPTTFEQTKARLTEIATVLEKISSVSSKKLTLALDEVSSSAKKTAQASAQAGRQIQEGLSVNGTPLSSLINQYSNLNTVVSDSDAVFEDLWDVLERVRSKQMTAKKGMMEFNDVLGASTPVVRMLVKGWENVEAMAKQMGISADDLAKRMLKGEIAYSRQRIGSIYLNRALAQQAQVFKSVRLGMGAYGTALQSLGRTMFWVGLGSMFIMMSWARMQRRAKQVTASAFSLKRAYVDLYQAQSNLKETMLEYGKTSKEAVLAQLRLEEAQMRVTQAEDNVRSATEQNIYATAMWIFGMVPTYIRASFEMTSSLAMLTAAKYQVAGASMVEAAGQNAAAGAITIHIPLIGGVTLAYWQWALAIGAVTFGLNILIGLLTQQYAMSQAEARIKKVREETEKWEDVLTGHSLVDSLEATRNKMMETNLSTKELSYSLSRLPLRSHSPLEIKTTSGWVEMSNLNADLKGLGAVSSTRSVNISVNGPWYIREEADITKIAKKIKQMEMRGIRNSTGGKI